jgi:hypothetical protein
MKTLTEKQATILPVRHYRVQLHNLHQKSSNRVEEPKILIENCLFVIFFQPYDDLLL